MLEPLGLYEGPVAPAQAPPATGTAALDRSTWADSPVRFASGLEEPGVSANPTAIPAGPDPDLRQPAADPVIVLDAESGAVHAIGACPAGRIRSPLAPKTDPWYHHRWYVDENHDFDAAGFELPPNPRPYPSEADQLSLFVDEDIQSFPSNNEPECLPATAWANLARLRVAPQRKPVSANGDFAQPDPPDDVPTLVYD